MSRIKQLRYRIGGVAAVLGVSVLVAACGGGGSSASTTAASSGSAATGTSHSNAAATATPASAKGVSISTTKGKEGTFLTGAGGRTVYLWVADANGMSSCSGACAKAWPPLTTHGKPIAGNGVTSSDLGTIKRSDGTTQVTYNGHPLYYFAGDSGSGTTNGQGSTQFGAPWWVVSPAGNAITMSSTGAASSSASSSSATGASSSGGASSSWS
jgi:predicted lipoprotein with Yx(FWY)xxD motif